MKIPVICFPCTIGVSTTDQLLPLSLEWNTRAFFPPDTIQVALPLITILVLLAAKAASPSTKLGNRSEGIFCHETPPSGVVITEKLPSIGSPIAIPSLSFQNCILS